MDVPRSYLIIRCNLLDANDIFVDLVVPPTKGVPRPMLAGLLLLSTSVVSALLLPQSHFCAPMTASAFSRAGCVRAALELECVSHALNASPQPRLTQVFVS